MAADHHNGDAFSRVGARPINGQVNASLTILFFACNLEDQWYPTESVDVFGENAAIIPVFGLELSRYLPGP
jgi:hypothetical protein